jgi:gamma-glutamyltranspeptidase/glutathione hydrolase
METNGGLISRADLASYRAVERAPLEGNYHGYHIITAPPPSAGGVGILQMLGMLALTDYHSDGPDSPKAVHYMAEIMRRYYADRSEYLGQSNGGHQQVCPLFRPPVLTRPFKTLDRAGHTGSPPPYETGLRRIAVRPKIHVARGG